MCLICHYRTNGLKEIIEISQQAITESYTSERFSELPATALSS